MWATGGLECSGSGRGGEGDLVALRGVEEVGEHGEDRSGADGGCPDV